MAISLIIVDDHDIIHSGIKSILKDEPEDSPFAWLKEFSTILNSCGRLEKASIGVGVCLNNESSKKKALQTRDQYKRQIVSAMRWYEENQTSTN